MIEIGIDSDLLEALLSGKKTIEGRLRTAKFVTLRTGDIITFREDSWQNDRIVASRPNAAQATISSTKFFDSFAAMLAAIDYRTAVPAAANQAEALAAYRLFYTAEQEAEHGVVAIEFSLH